MTKDKIMNSKEINEAIRLATGIERDDFDRCLNAMREAIKHMSIHRERGYGHHGFAGFLPELRTIVRRDWYAANPTQKIDEIDTLWLQVNATAAQRAEAFCRTIGTKEQLEK